tara:strand:- start:585 stop:1376 length:792 start_codon:yes stop_codon:yes gene_type:complete
VSWSYVRSGTAGQALVCLHGLGGNSSAFSPQLSGLSNKFRVWSLDLPGYGDSAPLLVMGWDQLVLGLKQFLDQHHLHKVHLLGHSFGGMLAQAFAAQYPDYLASLILYSTSAAFGSSDGVFQQQFIASRLKPLNEGATMPQLAAVLIDPLLAQQSLPEVRQMAIDCMAQVPSDTYRQTIKCISVFDCRYNLPQLNLPTLLLAGAEDPIASAPMMERLASKIQNAQICVLPNAGHLANLEQATLFNRQVSDFITQHEHENRQGI